MTGVPVLSLHDEGNWVDIKGLRNEVETAGLCLEAHMSYHSVFAEMEEVEKDLDRRIAEAKLRGSRRPLPCQAAKHGRTPPSAREVAKAAKASLEVPLMKRGRRGRQPRAPGLGGRRRSSRRPSASAATGEGTRQRP
ncbi:unnamed protein product [Effrenium voratum]|nr:unnamed protein product [Effrenium voratum]